MKHHHKLFLVFLFFLPVQLAYHFWPDWSFVFGIKSDYLSPTIFFTDIFFLVIFSLWLSILKKVDFKKAIDKNKKWIISLLFLVVLNIIFSVSWQVSVYKWFKFLEMLFVVVYVRTNWQNIKNKIYLPFSLSLFGLVIISFLQIYFQKTFGGIFWLLGERSFTSSTPGIALADFFGQSTLRPYAIFSHPNSLAGYSLIVGLIIYLFSKHLVGKQKLIAISGIISSIILVLISFSQLAWLALMLTVLALGFEKFIVGNFKLLVVCVILLSLLAPSVSKILINSQYFPPNNISERLHLNIVAGSLITKSPVLGIGNGNFVNIERIHFSKNILLTGDFGTLLMQPVHNIFLLLASECGLVGLAFAYLIFSKTIIVNTKNRNLLLLFPILVTGMGDHYWLTLQQNMLLFAIVLGIIFSSGKIQTEK